MPFQARMRKDRLIEVREHHCRVSSGELLGERLSAADHLMLAARSCPSRKAGQMTETNCDLSVRGGMLMICWRCEPGEHFF